MNDKKQIEEMAKEIEKAKQDIWASVRTQKEDEDYLWHSRAIAEHLIGQGYRKIPENAVVLERKEYNKLLNVVETIGKETLLQTRKETVIEILLKLYKICEKALKSNYRAIANREDKRPLLLTDELFNERCRGKIDGLTGIEYELEEIATRNNIDLTNEIEKIIANSEV